MYYSEKELAGFIKPTTLNDKPINPKTGNHYGKNTKKWWIWFYGLSPAEQTIVADMEANF